MQLHRFLNYCYQIHSQLLDSCHELGIEVSFCKYIFMLYGLTFLRTGLLTAVRRDCFRVLNYQELHFNDFGDRVAQLLHVQLISPLSQNQRGNLQQDILIVNTHLLFPHDSSLSIVRLHQVLKISFNMSRFMHIMVHCCCSTQLNVLCFL